MNSDTYHLRKLLIDIARAEVGTREEGTSNSGPRVRQYQAATSLGGTGWPWCAALVCWCIRKWIQIPDVAAAIKSRYNVTDLERWRPKTAAAFGFHEWAEDHGALMFDDSGKTTLHTGDIMTFDISHVGLVVNDDRNNIFTIEGNTSGPARAGSQRDGGGVWERVRQLHEARRFVRILP